MGIFFFLSGTPTDENNAASVASKKSSLQIEPYLLEDHVSKPVTTPDMPIDFLTL